MLYYLALTWNCHSAEQTASATRKKLTLLNRKTPNWQVALDVPGLVVLYHNLDSDPAYEIYRLPDDQGVVLGKLFKRSYINGHSAQHSPEPIVFDASLTHKVISSGGRNLIEDFWGGYVAFLRHSPNQERWVLRDPTGEHACQHIIVDDVDIYFVRLEDLECLGPIRHRINEHFLTGYLVYNSLSRRESGLTDIETILAGEAIYHRENQRSISSYWNLSDLANIDPIEDFDDAVHAAHYTLRSCVHAWASCYEGVVLSLSGGLDSSIILTCLKDAPNSPRISSRNYFMGTAPNADERMYARAVACKTNTKLLEIPTSAELITNFDEMEIRGAFPSGWPLDINEHLEDDEALKLEGYAAEFYGHGGDELFARLSFMPAAADYAWVKGIGTRFLSLVLEDCRRNSSSFWRTAKIAFGHGVRKKPWHPKYMVLMNRNPLISHRIFRDAFKDRTHWHPLYQHPNHIQPAKYEQAFMLTFGLGAAHVGINTHYPLRTRSPLKSQPLLELCARIPLWLHQKGGVDRAVARTAFSEALPNEIRFRSSKAFGTQKYRDLVQMKQHLIRRTLLNGYLVSQGFVDAIALENAIGQEVSAVQAETLPLCDLMSIELWARKFA